MRRSRAALATIEAAAMLALVASPRTIRSCTGAPTPSATADEAAANAEYARRLISRAPIKRP